MLAFSSFKAQAQIVNIAKLGEQENEGFGLRLETKSKLTSGNSHVESYAGQINAELKHKKHWWLLVLDRHSESNKTACSRSIYAALTLPLHEPATRYGSFHRTHVIRSSA